MTTEFTSPLRYPGGKSRAIDFIMNYIPDFKVYIEPFVGGSSIFLAAKQRFPNNKTYIINDLYTETYNFWKMIQDNPDELVSKIIDFKNQFQNGGRERGRELFQYLSMNKYKFNDIEKAASFFIINRSSFSGTSKGYSDDSFHNRFTDSSIQRLKELGESQLFKDVKIYNMDYQKIVELPIPKEYDNKDILLVADPPYYSATSSKLYGKDSKFDNLHLRFDHMRFANVMRKCPYNWLITYDDSEFIRKLFKFAQLVEFDLVYGMGNKKSINNVNGETKKGRELLISNMDIKHISPVMQHNVKFNIDPKQKSIMEAWI